MSLEENRIQEFEVFRELSIGHLIRRQEEISQLLKKSNDISFFDLMTESSKINLEIINFYKNYNTILEKEISKNNDNE